MPPPDAVAEPETEPATPSADAQAADAVATEATLAAALPEASPPTAARYGSPHRHGQRQPSASARTRRPAPRPVGRRRVAAHGRRPGR